MSSNKVQLRSFKAKDGNEVKKLINHSFGKAYILSKPSLFELPIILVAVANSKIVGFCSGDVLPGNLGLLDLLVVHPNFEKQGVGSALFGERMVQFLKLKITEFILCHWVKKDQPEPRIAIKHGFILQETVHHYWAKESVNLNYKCFECGPPPCDCTCTIYTKS